MSQWYEDLFTNYAHTYDKEFFTAGTLQETDFIEKEIGHDKSIRILDIGCGTGRHAIELAKRGYLVTGIDLSESQLQRAREKAKMEKVKVDFRLADARTLSLKRRFDLLLILCEGAFPLMETDEMNFKILKNATKALKSRGKLILTTLNALYPLYHSVKDFMNENLAEGKSINNRFDFMTFRDYSTFEVIDDNGKKKNLNCNERYYAPSEIVWLLKSLGYTNIDIFGCQTGQFERGKPLTTEDFEMLVVAER